MDLSKLFDLKALRKSVGGQIEDVLNKMLDESIMAKSKAGLKAAVHAGFTAAEGAAIGLVESKYESLVKGAHTRIKSWIDAIDGEVDAAPEAAPAAEAPAIAAKSTVSKGL